MKIGTTGFLHPAEPGMPIRVTLLQKGRGVQTIQTSKPSRIKGDGRAFRLLPRSRYETLHLLGFRGGRFKAYTAQADTDLFQCDEG